MLLMNELTLLELIKAKKVKVQLVAGENVALHIWAKMVKHYCYRALISSCLRGLVWWRGSCGAASAGGRGGERGLTLSFGISEEHFCFSCVSCFLELMFASFILRARSMFWYCCRYQQNLMGPGLVSHPGTPTRIRDNGDLTNHNSPLLRGKTLHSVQRKLFLTIHNVFDMLLNGLDTDCLFYRVWFLSKFLKKRSPKYSPNNDCPSDKTGKQNFSKTESPKQQP